MRSPQQRFISRKIKSYLPAIVAGLVAFCILAATCWAQNYQGEAWRSDGCQTGDCPSVGQPQGQLLCQPAQPPLTPISQPFNNQPNPAPHPAICRIKNSLGNAADYGSGTLVARGKNKAIVLTCAHLFREGSRNITVHFPNGKVYRAKLIGIDQANDLAGLLIDRPEITPVPIRNIQQGETLLACGYGQGSYGCASGVGTGNYLRGGTSYPSLRISRPVRSGDSGGGVFGRDRRLVGVIWGTDKTGGYITHGRPLRDFFKRLLNHLPRGLEPQPQPINRQPEQQPVNPYPQPQLPYPTQPPLTPIKNAWPPKQQPKPQQPINQQRLNQIDKRLEVLERQQDFSAYVKHENLKLYAKQKDLSRFVTTEQLEHVSKNSESRFVKVFEKIKTVTTENQHKSGSDLFSVAKFAAVTLGAGSGVSALIFGGSLLWRKLTAKRDQTEQESFQERRYPGSGRPESPIERPPENARPENIGPTRKQSISKRTDEQTTNQQTYHWGTSSQRPVAVDSPPPPQQVQTETHYVPYQDDQYSRAHQWASEQVVRKYPGSVEVMSALDSLIKQQINAK